MCFSPAHQDNFYYLNQGECPYVDDVDDAEGFEEMREAMDLVGIMEDQQLMIFRILAGILHIGNIDIQPSGEEESEIDVRQLMHDQFSFAVLFYCRMVFSICPPPPHFFYGVCWPSIILTRIKLNLRVCSFGTIPEYLE